MFQNIACNTGREVSPGKISLRVSLLENKELIREAAHIEKVAERVEQPCASSRSGGPRGERIGLQE